MKISARLFMVFVALCILLGAQEFRANLSGRVMDSSGAVIPGVTVQVVNMGTNQATTATTDETGTYQLSFLQPGQYILTAEATGFKKSIQDDLTLEVSQSARIDITLEVGEVTESVEVIAESPLLDTVKADRGGVIDKERIHELPLNGRNPFLLGAMVAGVNFHGAAIWQRPFDNGAIADWTINGGQQRGTEFLLDGAPNNGQIGGNNIAYVPPVDSVQEFKIHTNTYDAQYGKTNGGIINVTTKSGGNEFHGAGYEFLRRKSLDANSFQNNAKGVPRADHTLDQYGFQVDGPVFLPKIYDGRNKLFFMINYEGYREDWPQPLTLSTPEPEMKTGDFTKLVTAQGDPITIYDPATGRDVGGTWVRDPFPGNIIPADRQDPIAQNILGYMPEPNTTAEGQPYSQNNLFRGDNSAKDRFYNLVFKFDFAVNDSNRVFFRHASNDRTEMRNANGVFNGPGECCQLPFQRINDHITADWVSTISPTTVFNLRVSFNRFIQKFRSAATEGFDMTSLGFPQEFVSQLPYGAHFGRYRFDSYTDLGRYPGGNWTNTWAVHPNATKIAGTHTIKFGLDYRYRQYAIKNTSDVFRFDVGRNFTSKRYNKTDSTSGNDIATFLLGGVRTGRVQYAAWPYYKAPYFGFYVQDDWKVTRNLTLNLGLRWDINLLPLEKYDRLNRGFAHGVRNPVSDQVDGDLFPNFTNLEGGLQFAGVNGQGRRPNKTDYNNFQPRAGFAYRISDKIVMRGGWGLYYINPNNDDMLRYGFDQSTDMVVSEDGNRTFRSDLLSNPAPTGVQVPPGSSLGLATFLGKGYNVFETDFVNPYVHNFSFGFQFQLPHQTMIEASYVGNRTMKLQDRRDMNNTTAAQRDACNAFVGGSASVCNARVPNPFRGISEFEGTKFFTASTISVNEAERMYPHFGGINQRGLNEGRIWYNALQIQHRTRLRGDLNILTTYTLAKQIEQWGFNDPINMVKQRSQYFQDRPHRFTVAGVWQLPFGEGRKFGAGVTNGFAKRLIGGWEISAFLQWQSGRPWDLPSNVLWMRDGMLEINDWKAHKVQGVSNCVGDMNDDTGEITMMPYSVAAGCAPGQYDFVINPQYQPRTTPSRHPHIRLHSAPNLDMAINKTTMITERVRLQFRTEFFNATNTFEWGAQRGNFVNNPKNSNFGAFFPANASNRNRYPRYIQLGFKVLW